MLVDLAVTTPPSSLLASCRRVLRRRIDLRRNLLISVVEARRRCHGIPPDKLFRRIRRESRRRCCFRRCLRRNRFLLDATLSVEKSELVVDELQQFLEREVGQVVLLRLRLLFHPSVRQMRQLPLQYARNRVASIEVRFTAFILGDPIYLPQLVRKRLQTV